jgi:hypothetical protein
LYHCEFCAFQDSDETVTLTKAQLLAVEVLMNRANLRHNDPITGDLLPDVRELRVILDSVLLAAADIRRIDRIVARSAGE